MCLVESVFEVESLVGGLGVERGLKLVALLDQEYVFVLALGQPHFDIIELISQFGVLVFTAPMSFLKVFVPLRKIVEVNLSIAVKVIHGCQLIASLLGLSLPKGYLILLIEYRFLVLRNSAHSLEQVFIVDLQRVDVTLVLVELLADRLLFLLSLAFKALILFLKGLAGLGEVVIFGQNFLIDFFQLPGLVGGRPHLPAIGLAAGLSDKSGTIRLLMVRLSFSI